MKQRFANSDMAPACSQKPERVSLPAEVGSSRPAGTSPAAPLSNSGRTTNSTAPAQGSQWSRGSPAVPDNPVAKLDPSSADRRGAREVHWDFIAPRVASEIRHVRKRACDQGHAPHVLRIVPGLWKTCKLGRVLGSGFVARTSTFSRGFSAVQELRPESRTGEDAANRYATHIVVRFSIRVARSTAVCSSCHRFRRHFTS